MDLEANVMTENPELALKRKGDVLGISGSLIWWNTPGIEKDVESEYLYAHLSVLFLYMPSSDFL